MVATIVGPEVEPNDEPNIGHQRLWVDAVRLALAVKSTLITSSFDYVLANDRKLCLWGELGYP